MMITSFVCIIYLYNILLILQQKRAGYVAQLSQENLIKIIMIMMKFNFDIGLPSTLSKDIIFAHELPLN